MRLGGDVAAEIKQFRRARVRAKRSLWLLRAAALLRLNVKNRRMKVGEDKKDQQLTERV